MKRKMASSVVVRGPLLLLLLLLMGVVNSWVLHGPRSSSSRHVGAPLYGSKVKKGSQTKKRQGGFGKAVEKQKEAIGTGAKAQREQYAIFSDLVKKDTTQFAVLVRKAAKDDEAAGPWTAVGTVASSTGSAEDAIQLQRKLIFDHAGQLNPPLGLVAPTFLECGFYEGEGDDYDKEQAVELAKKVTPAEGSQVGFREIPLRQKAVRDRDRGYS